MKISEIDFTSKVDFTKGFSSYHIQWRVDNSWVAEEMFSPDFETTIRKNDGSSTVFTWYLGITKEKENKIGFGLGNSKNPPMPHGFIFRVALCNGNKDPFFNETYFSIFSDSDIARGHAPDLETASSFIGENLILHCWIDVPNDIPNLNKRKFGDDGFSPIDTFRSKSGGELLTGVSDMINGVLNEAAESKDLLSDVTLVVVDKDENGKDQVQRRFFGHRTILAARSPVFKTMFANKQWKEGADKDERIVEIKDVSASTMEYVLRFIYTGCPFPNKDHTQSNLKCEEFLAIVHAAEKYLLISLKDLCNAHLIFKCYTREDRLKQFLVADRYRLPQLKAVCLATLTTDPEGCDDGDEIPKDLFVEWHKAMARRQIDTEHIRLDGRG